MPAGVDHFATERAQIDFSGSPIPADFFEPGSEPFDGTVVLQGVPLDPTGQDTTDTIVERLAPAVLPHQGSEATVPIEMVALSLTSVDPIVVTGVGVPELWDVHVEVPAPQPGQLTIFRGDPLGGTFDSEFLVMADIRFERVSDPTDFREMMTSPAVQPTLSAPVPWDYFAPPLPPGLSPASNDRFFPYDAMPFGSPEFSLLLRLATVSNVVIPEPSTIGIAGLGLLALFRRRRVAARGRLVSHTQR